MKRFGLALLGTLWVAGCGAVPTSPSALQRPTQAAAAKSLGELLHNDMVKRFALQIKTFDVAPTDGQLSYAEFSSVASTGWFNAMDANHDGFVVMDEWLASSQPAGQVAALESVGHALLMDEGPGIILTQLTLDQYMADDFLIDTSAWLSVPADPAIKADAFKQKAGVTGVLDATHLSEMVGDLLAKGYMFHFNTTSDPAIAKAFERP